MKVAVITPYYKEKRGVLKRNIRSVAEQSYQDVMHVLVADGYPQDWIHDHTLHHLCIPNVGNYGDTPRGIGAAYAAAQGADAIIFLDADCWLEPDHIANMMFVASCNAGIVTCPRNIWLDSENMGECKESNGLTFNDTNCYLITKPFFHVCSAWMFKNQKDAIVGDRVFWDMVKRSGANILRCKITRVNYESDFVHHYQMFGLEPPKDAKIIVEGQTRLWGDVC